MTDQNICLAGAGKKTDRQRESERESILHGHQNRKGVLVILERFKVTSRYYCSRAQQTAMQIATDNEEKIKSHHSSHRAAVGKKSLLPFAAFSPLINSFLPSPKNWLTQYDINPLRQWTRFMVSAFPALKNACTQTHTGRQS